MKRFDAFAGYDLSVLKMKTNTRMSRMDPNGNKFLKSEARVQQHKQKIGKLVMQDVHLFNKLSFMPSHYPFELPITMMDAMLNTPSWQHEKTRLIAKLTLDALAMNDQITSVEIDSELLDKLADYNFKKFLEKCDVPELPPATIGTVEPLLISKVDKGCIATVATLDTTSTFMQEVKASLHSEVTILDNSETIKDYDQKKILENRQYGWKSKVIRQLIAPYLDCASTFALKRAYPDEDLRMKKCHIDSISDTFHMEHQECLRRLPTAKESILSLSNKIGDRRTFCICSSFMYDAIFRNDYVTFAAQIEVMRRLKYNETLKVPYTEVSNYKWWRLENIDQSSIALKHDRIFQVGRRGTILSGHVRKRGENRWTEEFVCEQLCV